MEAAARVPARRRRRGGRRLARAAVAAVEPHRAGDRVGAVVQDVCLRRPEEGVRLLGHRLGARHGADGVDGAGDRGDAARRSRGLLGLVRREDVQSRLLRRLAPGVARRPLVPQRRRHRRPAVRRAVGRAGDGAGDGEHAGDRQGPRLCRVDDGPGQVLRRQARGHRRGQIRVAGAGAPRARPTAALFPPPHLLSRFITLPRRRSRATRRPSRSLARSTSSSASPSRATHSPSTRRRSRSM